MPDHKKMIHIKVVCYDYDRILKKHKSNSLSTGEDCEFCGYDGVGTCGSLVTVGKFKIQGLEFKVGASFDV